MPSCRFLLVLLALLVLVPGSLPAAPANLTWKQARARSRVVSEVDYRFRFEFREGQGQYRGETRVSFDLSTVPARLHLDFQGEVLEHVEVNGTVLPEPRIEDHRLWFQRHQLVHGRNEILIRYRNDYDEDGTGLHRIVDPSDGREYLFTDFEPHDANRLFPCFDQPDLKASYQTTVLAPPSWTVVTSGRELRRRAEGDLVRWEFAPTARFSTYVHALCAGPFALWHDHGAQYPSRILCTQSMAEYMDPERIFEVTRQGFVFFDEYFGIPYPYEKYDQIFLPQFNSGAMENVACVTFNERHVFRSEPTEAELMGRANTILHEMAHMWFGDLVTMEWWNDLWLNESFATYMAHLALAEGTRFQDAWKDFSSGSKGWAYWQDQLPTTHPIETDVPDTLTTFTNFDGITYGKGAAVLKQLSFYVGAEAFRKGVSTYLGTFRSQNARREDFIRAIAEASGRDLEDWTERWLQNSGVNTITPEYRVDPRGRIERFELVQGEGNGDGVLRPHRLRVAFFHRTRSGLRRGKTVTVEVEGARTRVPSLEGRRAPDFLYANYGDHAYAKVYLDPRSLDFARERLELLPAGLRPVVWSMTWFMVRDRALDPRAFLDLFLAKAPLEPDARLVGTFRWSLPDALDHYLLTEDRSRYAARLHQIAWERMQTAEPGSDLQKIWYRYLVLASRSPEAQERLAGLLTGTREIPGFLLDPDKRWAAVERLCAQGFPGAPGLLEAEKVRDPSERGQKSAYQAWVSLPDAAVKAEAWHQFQAMDGRPLDHLRGGMGAFFRTGQEELTRDYVEEYFQALPVLLAERETSFVTSFVERLFPDVFHEESLLERTRQLLADHPEYPYFLRRSLLESNDELARSLAIRQP